MKHKLCTWINIFCILMLLPFVGEAQDSDQKKKNYQLKTIEVVDEDNETEEKSITAPTGKTEITRDDIETMPISNGDLNEYLKARSTIKFDDDHNTSANGGEIAPSKVSISGAKSYQNNFTIDGVSNNSLLDPDAENPYSINDIPGAPQKIFLDPDLVEKMDVYEDNIPVEYGGFLGGVVDADTKIFEPEFKGTIKYRTTRDGWTKFFTDDEDEFENSSSHNAQPKFIQHQGSIMLNIPWTEEFGSIFHYQRHESKIDLKSFNKPKSERRINQNYFIKSTWLTDDGELNLNLKHAPYKSTYFMADVKDSDITVKGGGTVVSTDYTHELENGNWKVQLSYDTSVNERKANDDFFTWKNTRSLNWGRTELGEDVSRSGGYGHLKSSQTEMAAKGQLVLTSPLLTRFKNNFKVGYEVKNITGTKERVNEATQYTATKINPDVNCNQNTYDCIDNEQYFTHKTIRPKYDAQVSIKKYAFYMDDTINLWRFKFKPGFRYDYDDYMDNHNVAPRINGAFDVWGNQNTVLIAGKNRYYTQGLLQFKLKEEEPQRVTYYRTTFRNTVTDWSPSSFQGASSNRFSNLETPYNEEIVYKIRQKFFGGTLELKKQYRETYKDFSREYGPIEDDGLRYYTIGNNGRSSFETLALSYTLQNDYLAVNFNVSKSDRETNRTGYSDLENKNDSRVFYDDALILSDNLPRDKFDEPMRAVLNVASRWIGGFRVAMACNYTEEQTIISRSDEVYSVPPKDRRLDPDTGERIEETVPMYEDKKYDSTLLVDLKLKYRMDIYGNQLTAAVDINNVFNKKVSVVGVTNSYRRGRQFFAGLQYDF